MAVEKGEIEEDCMVAVIDAGCNLTCHGSQWIEEYLKATGMDILLEPSNGKFNGVGGKIKVKGLRKIPVSFGNGSEAKSSSQRSWKEVALHCCCQPRPRKRLVC